MLNVVNCEAQNLKCIYIKIVRVLLNWCRNVKNINTQHLVDEIKLFWKLFFFFKKLHSVFYFSLSVFLRSLQNTGIKLISLETLLWVELHEKFQNIFSWHFLH